MQSPATILRPGLVRVVVKVGGRKFRTLAKAGSICFIIHVIIFEVRYSGQL